MSCMRDVRKRSERTEAMFDPLRETVASLHGAGVALPDGVLRQVGWVLGWVTAGCMGLGWLIGSCGSMAQNQRST